MIRNERIAALAESLQTFEETAASEDGKRGRVFVGFDVARQSGMGKQHGFNRGKSKMDRLTEPFGPSHFPGLRQ